MELLDAYKSLNEALSHAGIHTHTKLNVLYINAEDVEEKGIDILSTADAILVPGGFGSRGLEGKLMAVRYARENKIPYLGICLGMQSAVIEFARNVLGITDANSTEFDKETPNPIIGLITEWTEADGSVAQRSEQSDLGGTMRLGAQDCHLVKDSKVAGVYDATTIVERHRHRYEFNNHYLEQIQKAGMRISGWSSDDSLVEVVELPDHPWFVACQFHPEFTSNPRDGHPLFTSFVAAALENAANTAK